MSPFDRRTFMKAGVLSVAAAANAKLAEAETERLRSPNLAARGIKVACSLDLWTAGGRAPLEKALDGASAAGYQWVEGNATYLWDYRDRLADLSRMLEQRRLGWITGVYTANFPDMDQENENIRKTVLISRALKSLNAEFLTLGSEWGGIERQPLNFHYLSRNLSECGALVYEDGGLHCAYRFKEGEAADIRKIIATSDSRYTKFCLDTLYLMRVGVDPVPMIRAYAGRVIHVQLHDGTDEGGQWRESQVGQGKLDVGGVLQALCETRYNGWVTVQQEHVQGSPDRAARESRERVEEKLEAYSLPVEPSETPASNPERATLAPQPERRETLYQIAKLGAAMSTGIGILRPVAFSPGKPTGESPMAGMSQAMMRDMSRPVPPLPPKDPNFKPFFFTEEEYRDVSALVDVIIPADGKPGGLDARADEYADFMIWLEQGNQEVTQSQAAVESGHAGSQGNSSKAREEAEGFRRLCVSRYGKDFSDLTPAQAGEFLTGLTTEPHGTQDRAAQAFFNRIRGLAVHAYYTSPQGLIEDLGYKGNTYVSEFKGCTDPKYLGKWYQKPSPSAINES